ncbi:MAG: hypothetical protein WCL27_14550 [Betaproteobacteria bacterium]
MQNQPGPDRQVAFQLGKVLTQALREIYRAFDGDLTMALVLGELGQYSAAPLHDKRHNQRSRNFRCCNAYSISTASGVPPETVRRKLDKLIALGWIIKTEDGNLGLNPQHDPPLAIVFSEYNRNMLQVMRETVALLEGIESEKT